MQNFSFGASLAISLLAGSVFGQNIIIAQGSSPNKLQHYSNSLAPYVVSPQSVVERMLELADLRPGEVVYDLGSGDGRILITAVQRFHARAVGVELSDSLAKTAVERITKLGIQNDARVIHGDLMDVDLSPADVVTIYLMTTSNQKLRPHLEQYLHPGARVVSHDYPVPGWEPKRVERGDNGDKHIIYLYQLPRARK